MIRVVHLFGHTPDFSAAHAAAMLQTHAPHDICIDRRQVGIAGSGGHSLRSLLKLRRSSFEVLHAWDFHALSMAALATSSRIFFSPSEFSNPAHLTRLSILMRFRDVKVVCSTSAQRELMLRLGIPADRCRQIAPGIDPDPVSRERDANLREELGLAADDLVMLAPGESTRPAEHRLALWAVSILHVLDPRYRLLVWGRGEQTSSLQTLARKLWQPKVLICAQQALKRQVEFQSLPAAADMVLATARPAAAPLALAICMASGKAIIGNDDGLAGQYLSNGHSAAMVSRDTARLLAQRIHEIAPNIDLQRNFAAAARQAANTHFARPQFLNGYFEAYRELAGPRRREENAVWPQMGIDEHR